MPLTLAQLETMLVARAGPLMARATMDVTTAGANPSLVDPLRSALGQMGVTVADPAAITDADLVTIGQDRLDELLDRAELRVLKTILRRLNQPDFTIPGPISIRSLWRQVESAINQMEREIRDSWGIAGGGVAVVGLDLGIDEEDA